MRAPRKDVYYIEVVGRALDVLEVFIHEEKAQLTLKDIAKRLDQSMNTVFRLLYTLSEHGYVVKTNKKYELGPKLLDLSNAKLRNTDLIAVAAPYMEKLRDRFGETVNLGVVMDRQVRYIDVKESLERFRLAESVGGSDPLHCTALGKAHLAFYPFADALQMLPERRLPRVTEYTITSVRAMKAELERIRELGFAVDRQESMRGAFCVAAPILNAQKIPIAAISIAGPSVRFNEVHLGPASEALLKTTAEISRKLAASGTAPGRTAEEKERADPGRARKPRTSVAV